MLIYLNNVNKLNTVSELFMGKMGIKYLADLPQDLTEVVLEKEKNHLISQSLISIKAQKYLIVDSGVSYLIHPEYSYVLRVNLFYSPGDSAFVLTFWPVNVCAKCRTFPHLSTCSEKY